MLYKALLNCKEALPEWPDAEHIEDLKAIVEDHHDALRDVYCVMDGLKLDFEQCNELEKQGMFYNKWTHGHRTIGVACRDLRVLHPVIFTTEAINVLWSVWIEPVVLVFNTDPRGISDRLDLVHEVSQVNQLWDLEG
jgi:hypothetical protein